jgi:hypothetical protein
MRIITIIKIIIIMEMKMEHGTAHCALHANCKQIADSDAASS